MTGRGQLIDQEIGHVIDQTIILFMIGKKRRIENEANHVIRSLIGNGHGEFFSVRGVFLTCVKFLI